MPGRQDSRRRDSSAARTSRTLDDQRDQVNSEIISKK